MWGITSSELKTSETQGSCMCLHQCLHVDMLRYFLQNLSVIRLWIIAIILKIAIKDPQVTYSTYYHVILSGIKLLAEKMLHKIQDIWQCWLFLYSFCILDLHHKPGWMQIYQIDEKLIQSIKKYVGQVFDILLVLISLVNSEFKVLLDGIWRNLMYLNVLSICA